MAVRPAPVAGVEDSPWPEWDQCTQISLFEDTPLLFSDYINGGTVLATYKKQ